MDRENVYIIPTVTGKSVMYVFEGTVYNNVEDLSDVFEMTEEQKNHLTNIALEVLDKWVKGDE